MEPPKSTHSQGGGSSLLNGSPRKSLQLPAATSRPHGSPRRSLDSSSASTIRTTGLPSSDQLISQLMHWVQEPPTVHLHQLVYVCEAGNIPVYVHRFERLLEGESIQQCILRAGDSVLGPTQPNTVLYANRALLKIKGLEDMKGLEQWASKAWGTLAAHRSEWQALMKNLRVGNYRAICVRGVLYGETPRTSRQMHFITWPVVLEDEDGTRAWGMIRQPVEVKNDDPIVGYWGARDLLSVKTSPTPLTIVDPESGHITWQNAASMAAMGNYALLNTLNRAGQISNIHPEGAAEGEGETPEGDDFLGMLFMCHEGELETLRNAVKDGGMYRTRLEILHPVLRERMQLDPEQQIFHDVHVSQLKDPVMLVPILLVAQIDVTATVLAEYQLQTVQRQQQALLQQILPQEVIDVLLDLDRTRIRPRRSLNGTDEGDSDASALILPAPMKPMTPEPSQDVHHVSCSFSGAHSMSMTVSGETEVIHNNYHAQGLSDCGTGTGEPDPAVVQGYRSQDTEMDCVSLGSGPQLTKRDVHKLAHMHGSVSVLFTDIKGFTAMSQKLEPGRVMMFLNELYSEFDALLEVHDVYKVETIGDCYMVAAGLFDRSVGTSSPPVTRQHSSRPGNDGEASASPQPFSSVRSRTSVKYRGSDPLNGGKLGGHDPDHANKMLQFAKALVATAARIPTPEGKPVEMRVGIHSGPVMSGVVGRRCPRFCLFGDCVNCASRLETTGVPGRIHVSEAYSQLLPDEHWLPTDGVYMKGKGHMQTFFLDWEGDNPAATREEQ